MGQCEFADEARERVEARDHAVLEGGGDVDTRGVVGRGVFGDGEVEGCGWCETSGRGDVGFEGVEWEVAGEWET